MKKNSGSEIFVEIMAFFQNFDFFPKKSIFLKHSLWLQFIHQYSGHKESFLPIGIFQTGSFFGGEMPFLKKVVKCKHKPMWNSTYEAEQARPRYTFNYSWSVDVDPRSRSAAG